jgi:hypothetical protein
MKNEKYFISVGEPWDFESQDGQNIIRGNILSVKSNQCLVFKSNYYLKFGEIKGDILILTPRHKGNDFSDLQNELVVVNGSLLLKEYNKELSEKELQENAKFEIIGSIRKEQSPI